MDRVGRFGATAAVFTASVPLLLCSFAATAGAADIDVNSGIDMPANDGNCTLREAVQAASTGTASGAQPGECPGGDSAPTTDHILLDAGATYSLIGAAGEDLNASGDLDIIGNGPVSIEGTGSPAPTIDPNDNDRAIDARDTSPGDSLTVEGVMIIDGTAPASGGGAIVINGATVNASDVSLLNNVAGNAPTSNQRGGAIMVWNMGTLNMSSSLLFLNQAISTTGTAGGGGIYVFDDGTATIDRSVIASNSVLGGGSAATNGGGIASGGDLTLRNTAVITNSVSGGGIEVGGGVSAGTFPEDSFTAVNTTISSNSLATAGIGEGGGLKLQSDLAVDLVHTTIADNLGADTGDAIQISDNDGVGANIDVRGSILTGPDATDVCAFDMSALTSEDHNVTRGTSCGLTAANDAEVINVGTGVIGSNGGPLVGAPGFQQTLRTNAIGAGSPAFDHVPTAACLDDLGGALTTDARGSVRPSGAACDSGAFELFVPPINGVDPPPNPPSASSPRCRGATATVLGSDSGETLTGTPQPDVIVALGGNDRVVGLGGDDVICSGAGGDTAKGGPGNDLLLGETGRDTLFGQGGKDRLSGGRSKRDICNGGGGKDRTAKGCETRRQLP